MASVVYKMQPHTVGVQIVQEGVVMANSRNECARQAKNDDNCCDGQSIIADTTNFAATVIMQCTNIVLYVNGT